MGIQPGNGAAFFSRRDFFHTACKIVEKTKEAVDFTAEYRRDKLWATGKQQILGYGSFSCINVGKNS